MSLLKFIRQFNQHKDSKVRSRLKLLSVLLTPMAPVLLAVLVLQMYGPSGDPLTTSELKSLQSQNFEFVYGRITYVAVTTLYYFVFTIIIFLYCNLWRNSPGPTKKVLRSSLWPGIFVAALFSGLFYLAGEWNLTIHQLSSINLLTVHGIEDEHCGISCLYLPSQTLREWSSHGCRGWWEFQIASTLPVIPAVVTTIALAAFTNAQVLRFGADKHGSTRLYFACHHMIMRCLPMASSLLVTGVISSAVWFHLPVVRFRSRLLEGSDKGGENGNQTLESALQKLQSYGDEMTLFWGVTYTLIVVVVIALPIWRLVREKHAVCYAYGARPATTGRTSDSLWLTRQILVVLAPLISSLLFNWLENSS